MRPIGTAGELERRRRRAVELVKGGEPPGLVASLLGCGRSSVSTWLKAEREAGGGLAARPHGGPRPRPVAEQVRELERLLRQGAGAQGWPEDRWSVRRVVEEIRRRFGVEYHVEHVRKLMRGRLNRSNRGRCALSEER